MTKWDLIQMEKAEKKIEELNRKQHIGDLDLYYRYQGKTIVKTKHWREAVREIKQAMDKLSRIGIDPDIEPLLFDCVWYQEDPLGPVYTAEGMLPVNNIFRSMIYDDIFDYGIKKGDREAWLRELTTKKK